MPQKRQELKDGKVKRLEKHLDGTKIFIIKLNQNYLSDKKDESDFHYIVLKQMWWFWKKITGLQYDLLMEKYDKKDHITQKVIVNKYDILHTQNGLCLLTCFVMNYLNHPSGTVVCLCSDGYKIPSKSTVVSNLLENVSVFKTNKNPSDYDFPSCLVSVFRGYPWTFENSMT